MKTSRHILLALVILVAFSATGTSHQFYVTLYGRNDADGSIGLQVFDGVTSIEATRHDSGQTESGNDLDGDGVWENSWVTDPWTTYSATVPDAWLAAGRGVSFHVPSYGLTGFELLYDIDSNPRPHFYIDTAPFPRRTPPNPFLNYSRGGNRLMLGRWWSAPTVQVADLVTWDNDNPYWPAVGVDFSSSSPHSFWRWMHPNDAGTGAAIAMDLDDLHTLTLRGRTNANRVQLDPELGRITINGAPVLTSANAASALGATFITPAQLEGRSYLSSAGGRVGLGAGATLRPLQPAQNQVGQAVLGRYNDPARTEGVLIVGTGQRHADGTITRQNGLRILDDGTVLIQPKGGLQMTLGVFDKGPQP